VSVASLGALLEVGAYCGKSTIYLGAAARQADSTLFSLDHHRGSEEHQAGEESHDERVVDSDTGLVDTLPHWRRTVAAAGLEATVVGIVGDSRTVAAHWNTPLALVFVDGSHSPRAATNDYEGWAPRILRRGLLVVHDVFPDPAEGGRPPYEIYRRALGSGAKGRPAFLDASEPRLPEQHAAEHRVVPVHRETISRRKPVAGRARHRRAGPATVPSPAARRLAMSATRRISSRPSSTRKMAGLMQPRTHV